MKNANPNPNPELKELKERKSTVSVGFAVQRCSAGPRRFGRCPKLNADISAHGVPRRRPRRRRRRHPGGVHRPTSPAGGAGGGHGAIGAVHTGSFPRLRPETPARAKLQKTRHGFYIVNPTPTPDFESCTTACLLHATYLLAVVGGPPRPAEQQAASGRPGTLYSQKKHEPPGLGSQP